MKRSNLIPLLLLVYLAVMSYIGLDEFRAGNYLFYFGIIGITLACIFMLRIVLRRREDMRRRDDGSGNRHHLP